MASIYAKTSQLITWLGDKSGDSEVAITTVTQACKELEDQGRLENLWQTDLTCVKMKDASGEFNLATWLAVIHLLQ